MRNWLLFFAHPTCWHERVTFNQNAQDSVRCWFWVESSKSLSNENLEIIPICNVVLYSYMTILFEFTCVMNVRNQTPTVCHMLLSILWWPGQAYSLTTKYPVYQFEPELAVQNNLTHTFDNSPTDPISSSLKWWSSKHGLAALCNCWIDLFASSLYLSTHFFASPSMSWEHEDIVSASAYTVACVSGNFPQHQQKSLIRTHFFSYPQYPC